MTSIRSTLCTLSCCFFVLTGSAFADIAIIDYTLTGPTDTITFSLPQVPAVQTSCSFADSFCITPVTLVVDGSTIDNGTVAFYTPGDGGGLTLQEGNKLLVNQGGPGYSPSVPGSGAQLFTGPLANPTLGTYVNTQLVGAPFDSPTYNESFVLNATASSVTPEPGSYAALILAFSCIMLVIRSRRAKQRT